MSPRFGSLGQCVMSLRANLLILYSLLLSVLLVALGGFYWAVEHSMADLKLLKVAQNQVRELETFSANVNNHLKETEDLLLLDHGELEKTAMYRQRAEANMQHLLDFISSELEMFERRNKNVAMTQVWQVELEEQSQLYQLKAIFRELCQSSEWLLTHRNELSREEIVQALRGMDDKFDQQFAVVIEEMVASELAESQVREMAMFHNSQLFERITIITCLSTFLIAVFGAVSMRRALRELAKEGAEAADRAKSEFLANMSHEIRTPMTAILGFTEFLAQGVAEPEKIEAAGIIKRNGELLLEIIKDILDLSKIDSGQLQVERSPCSPWEIIEDITSLMRVRAEAKDIDLKVEFKGLIPETIHSNPVRLRQILINLIGNAIKFTTIGGVRLVTELIYDKKGHPKLQFDVIDTGVGISKQGLNSLFKPFTQVDTLSAKATEGTGLGLAISQRLAQLLGGSITATSTFGMGSTFSVAIQTGPLDGVKMIALPEGACSCKATPPTKMTPRPSPTPTSPQKNEKPKLNSRILLVEDGPDNQRLISVLLRRAGADVTLAENGLAALDKIRQVWQKEDPRIAPFDAILMDMQMPLMDGYETTQELRKQGYAHPIIALTAYAMSTDRQKCLDAGCNDYVTKPISEENLLTTLVGCISKANVDVMSEVQAS
jgi:signal transduction histidine kinase/ActR/RegA family two-component response regulator